MKGFSLDMKFLNKFLATFILGAIGLVLVACDDDDKSKIVSSPLVSAITIHRHEVPIVYEYAGRIAAFKETKVRARVGGILLQHNFIEGEYVKKGDLLFEIDPAFYQAEVEIQTALVAQAQAIYEQSVRDSNRTQALLQKRVQSTALYDQMIAKRDENAAILQQKQAALRTAQLNLSYTKVIAPISGVASREAMPEGSLVNTEPSSNLLMTITQNDPVYINFSYTDVEAREIRKLMSDMNAQSKKINKLKIKIHFGDGREYKQLGIIDFTSPVLDTTTGMLDVRAIVRNPDGFLVPGQFVRITIIGLKLNNVIVIPEAALLQDKNGTFVYLVNSLQHIEKRSVVVVRQLKDRSWLLAPSEKINDAAHVNNADTMLAGLPKNNNQEAAAELIADKYTGLNDGDIIITEGHYRISSAMTQLPLNMKLKVVLTMLDGSNVRSPKAADSSAGLAK
ncbi:MAG: multidrug efflux system [Candidatus Tokpelaia sp. JSC188]|nr:MAG: multidrug efflux system [Candidatus Tokpelaia sp. JSC188]